MTTDTMDHASGLDRENAAGVQTLVVSQSEQIEILARLRETQGDVRGRAFAINLDQLIVRLGGKWDVKQALVYDNLRKSFLQRFQEPNWCAQLDENIWIASTIAVGSRQGALKCAEIWHDTGQFFVGDISDTRLPLFEVRVEDANCLTLRQIDLNSFFDRDEDFMPRSVVKAQPIPAEKEMIDRPPDTMAAMVSMSRPALISSFIAIGGKDLQVACAVEPVFELKNLGMIGHRLEPSVIDRTGNVQLDSKALKGMDWTDREKVDLANIEEGLQLLRKRSSRKILIVVPVAFSTMASARSRAKATADVSKAAAEMGMKILYEIRGLDGVPSHRIVEIVSLIKPACMTVVGHVGADLRSIQAVRNCGFSGICVTYDGVSRTQEALQAHLADLTVAAKAAGGACMVQGFDNLRQMAVARLAGVSHASVKASALQTAGGRSPEPGASVASPRN